MKRLSVVFFAMIVVSQFSFSMEKKKAKMTNIGLYDRFVYSDAILPFVCAQSVLLQFRCACKLFKEAVSIFSEKNPIEWNKEILESNYDDFLRILKSIDFFIAFDTRQDFLFGAENERFKEAFDLIKEKLKRLVVYEEYNNLFFIHSFSKLKIDSLMLYDGEEAFLSLFLQNLPEGLSVLKLGSLCQVEDYHLIKLPNDLKELYLFQDYTYIGECFKFLPKNLKKIVFSPEVYLEYLKHLPPEIKVLDFSLLSAFFCDFHRMEIPDSFRPIEIVFCKELQDLDERIKFTKVFKNLESIETIDMKDAQFDLLGLIFDYFPKKLKVLKVNNLKKVDIGRLEYLPNTLSCIYVKYEHYDDICEYCKDQSNGDCWIDCKDKFKKRHNQIHAIKKLREKGIEVLTLKGKDFPDSICKCADCAKPVVVKFSKNGSPQIIDGHENLGYYRRNDNRKLELTFDNF